MSPINFKCFTIILLFIDQLNVKASSSATDDTLTASFELTHKHSFSNSTTIDNKLERTKRLIHDDNLRQIMISSKLGRSRSRSRSRRKALEEKSEGDLVDIPMYSAADTGTGQYFVTLEIGTPRKKFALIVDTGSDLTWMICNYDCEDCSGDGRVFDAVSSESFKPVTCSSSACKVDLVESFALSSCPAPTAPCGYEYRYADGTKIAGIFANETVTVTLQNNENMSVNDVLIGCSKVLEGEFHKADGVMGLGYDKHSFGVNIVKRFSNKFSYCLVDHLSPTNLLNYLHFGNVPTKPPNMNYTNLILGVINPFYVVSVSGISIDGKMLDIDSEIWDVNENGGVFVDSGSSLTHLVEPVYVEVMKSLKGPLMNLKRVNARLGLMEFCFSSNGYEESMVPKLTIHFEDGVEFVPPVKNYVIDVADGVKCIGFASSSWPGACVIGNILQQEHYWEFDIGRSTLGFAPSTCTKHVS